jgi:stage II sporulation protein M
MSKKNSDNFRLKCSDFFKGLYNRNKTVLTVSVTIFLAFLFIGILTGYFSSDFIGNLLKTYVNLLYGAHIEISTLSIFMHNLQAALIAYFGGIIGIIPFGVLSFNGFFYGAFLGYLLHGSIVTSSGVLTVGSFIIYTVPHGIFEITGFIISGAAGFRITTLVMGVIKNAIKGKPISDHYWKFKDSLALLAIAIVLIFIAAIIEVNITLSVGNYITNLNLTIPGR